MRKRMTIVGLSLAVLLLASYAIGERALVIKFEDELCTMFDGDGGLVMADGGIAVVTNSETGRVNVRCSVRNVDNSTGRAVRYDVDDNPLGPGLQCGWIVGGDLLLTDDWKETVSASGNARLTCKFTD